LDANRLSQGQLVAAVAAIVLFIITFLPWFSIGGASVTVGGTTIGGSENLSLWKAENPFDIYILIVILVAVVPTALLMFGGGGDFPLAPIATTLLAGVGTILVIYQLFDHGDYSLKIGFFLGLIAIAAVTIGGYLMMQEDVGGERY
jgi:hypothetical protein